MSALVSGVSNMVTSGAKQGVRLGQTPNPEKNLNKIAAADLLALTANMGMSWKRNRELKRFVWHLCNIPFQTKFLNRPEITTIFFYQLFSVITFDFFSRWLKEYGIQTESEKSQRRRLDLIIGDNIVAATLPMEFPDEKNGGMMIQQAPCVQVDSLVAKVQQQLEEYDM